jgi:hypothetical protein
MEGERMMIAPLGVQVWIGHTRGDRAQLKLLNGGDGFHCRS